MESTCTPSTPSPCKTYISNNTSTPSPFKELSSSICNTPSPFKDYNIVSTPSPFKHYNIVPTPSPFQTCTALSNQNFQTRLDIPGANTSTATKRLFEDKAPPPQPKKRRGRKSKAEKFPELVPVVRDFIYSRGFGAHERRRETVGSVGASLAEIKQHVISELPELAAEGISLSTITRLFPAPNKHYKSAARHKGFVPARVGRKSNSKAKGHDDSHFAAAQVKYALELASCYEAEFVCLSADAKAKVNVGGAAVSRYVKMKSFCLENDMPVLSDHDFPMQPKIVPMGYMQLLSKKRDRRARSQSPDRRSPNCDIPEFRDDTRIDGKFDTNCSIQHDLQGRAHYKFARTGPLHIVFRASSFHKDCALTHYEDLCTILRPLTEKKKALVLVVDNGPDWHKNSAKTFLAMGRLWKDLKLDYLLLVSYAPGDSKFNPIEHAWAPITIWWSGLVLPAPADQETETVMDNAMQTLQASLRAKKYDGFGITTTYVPCNTSQDNICREEAAIDQLSNGSLKAIKADTKLQDLKKEYQLYNCHAVSRTYALEYRRCQSADCQHCTSFKPTATNALALLHKTHHLFTPVLCEEHPEHYSTFMDLVGNAMTNKQLLRPDEGIPSKGNNTAWCTCAGCNKVFQSHADVQRHNKIVHKTL